MLEYNGVQEQVGEAVRACAGLISVSTTETNRKMWMNVVMKEEREEKELTYEIGMKLMPAHSKVA